MKGIKKKFPSEKLTQKFQDKNSWFTIESKLLLKKAWLYLSGKGQEKNSLI